MFSTRNLVKRRYISDSSYADLETKASTFVLLEARGLFFGAEGGGQLLDFENSVRITQDKNVRLDPGDAQVVPDGHYMWFKRQGSRQTAETPLKREWLLSSRVITAQGSVNASGTATPNRVKTSCGRLPPVAN